jgi:hypothetical protein
MEIGSCIAAWRLEQRWAYFSVERNVERKNRMNIFGSRIGRLALSISTFVFEG